MHHHPGVAPSAPHHLPCGGLSAECFVHEKILDTKKGGALLHKNFPTTTAFNESTQGGFNEDYTRVFNEFNESI